MEEQTTKTDGEENYDKDPLRSIEVECSQEIFDKILTSHQEPPIGGGGGESFFFDIPQDYYEFDESSRLKGGHRYDIRSLNANTYTAISKVSILTETKEGGVTFCVYKVSNIPNPNIQLRLWLADKKDAPEARNPDVVIGNDNGVSITTDKKLKPAVMISKKMRKKRANYSDSKKSVVKWELYDSSYKQVLHSAMGDDMYYFYIMFHYPH